MLGTASKTSIDVLRRKAKREGLTLSISRKQLGATNLGGLRLTFASDGDVLAGERHELTLEAAAHLVEHVANEGREFDRRSAEMEATYRCDEMLTKLVGEDFHLASQTALRKAARTMRDAARVAAKWASNARQAQTRENSRPF